MQFSEKIAYQWFLVRSTARDFGEKLPTLPYRPKLATKFERTPATFRHFDPFDTSGQAPRSAGRSLILTKGLTFRLHRFSKT